MVLSVPLGIANALVVQRTDHTLKMASTLEPGKRPTGKRQFLHANNMATVVKLTELRLTREECLLIT